MDISADAEQDQGIFENLHGFTSGAQLSQTLLGNTQKYYGAPFIHFLEYLTNSKLEQEKEMIKKSCKQFLYEYLPSQASGQVHRVCERFGLIATAGELATRYGITGWQEKLGIHNARHTHKHDAQQKIHSLGTARNYNQALTRVTQWIQENKLGDLKNLSSETALQYLELRGQSVSQKMLNQERQAIQLHLGIKLPVITSELSQTLKSRAYSKQQIEMISHAQTPKHQLATQIAYAAGLRAHELLTLRLPTEQPKSKHRQWSPQRFTGRQGIIYTVIGKGGLIREVMIPHELANQLEQLRCTPMTIKDRNIYYKQYYAIGSGHNWSNTFSAAAKRTLGWSHGAHGLRHTYVQQRMNELQQQGLFYQEALSIVSQEIGHFRADITEVYLR